MHDEQLSLVRDEGGVVVLKLRGEHDLSTAQAVRSALRSAVESGPPAVVVDLSDTTFLDSSILGALIGAYRDARARDAGFAIAAGDDDNGPVRRILDLTGLMEALPVRSELEDALRAVGEQTRAS